MVAWVVSADRSGSGDRSGAGDRSDLAALGLRPPSPPPLRFLFFCARAGVHSEEEDIDGGRGSALPPVAPVCEGLSHLRLTRNPNPNLLFSALIELIEFATRRPN